MKVDDNPIIKQINNLDSVELANIQSNIDNGRFARHLYNEKNI